MKQIAFNNQTYSLLFSFKTKKLMGTLSYCFRFSDGKSFTKKYFRYLSQNIMKRNQKDQQQIPNNVKTSTTIFHTPRNGIDIAFQNISYAVKIQKNKKKYINVPWKRKMEDKVILRNISGIFKAGRVSAIMGASGAGKTTLLNILACRINYQNGGKLYANDIPYNYKMFGDFANYVMQSDLLMQTLTVRQTLQFATDLKVNASRQEKKERVRLLSNQLKLQKCLDTVVGGVTIKGISGGEKKRASIAFELISDPQVIFLDEPTSGLDSLTSYIIVSYLRRLAKKTRKTIIMTIHQPNSQTYDLFDDLLLMVEGKIIYQGNAHIVTTYFTQNFQLKTPSFSNPPDFFMSKIHHQSQQNRNRYPMYMETYDNKIAPNIQTEIENRQRAQLQLRKHETRRLAVYGALLKRNLINTVRNPLLMKAKVLQGIFLSLFAGGLFFDAAKGDLTVLQDFNYLAGCLFFIAINAFTTTLSPTTITFPLQRPVFLKEQDSKMYTVWQYSMARFITDIPELIIIPVINCVILYFMIGLQNTASQFFTFLLTYILLGLAGNSIGLLIGSAILDQKSVAAVVPIVILPLMLFSGFFKNREDLPGWISWLEYISPIKYGFIAFMENQVSDKPSQVATLAFDLGLWASIFILLGLGMGYRLLSVLFLAVMKKKMQ